MREGTGRKLIPATFLSKCRDDDSAAARRAGCSGERPPSEGVTTFILEVMLSSLADSGSVVGRPQSASMQRHDHP